MVRQTASLIFLEILGGLILLAIVAAGLLAFRLSSGPMDLAPFKDDLERALTEARDGRPVRLGSVQLEWSQEDRRLHISGSHLDLMDSTGNLAAQAERANIVLSGSSFVLGKVEVLRLELDGGWLNVDQLSPTKWAVAGDPLPEIPAGELPQTPQEWLERINQVLPAFYDALSNAEDTLAAEYIGYEDFEFRVRDMEGQPLFDLTESNGQLSREENGVRFMVAGSGAGAGLPAGLAAALESNRTEARLHAEFAVADWPLADLFARFGAPADAFSGLPADADIAMDFDRAAGIDRVIFHARSGEGTLPYGGGMDVTDLDATLTYLAREDDLVIDISSAKAGPAGGDARIALRDVLKGEAEQSFELTSNRLTLDFMPRFDVPLELTGVTAAGTVTAATKEIRNLDLFFESGGTGFHLTGDIAPTPDRQEGEPPILADLTLETSGDVAKETILAFWPATLGKGARDFAAEGVEAEAIRNVKGHITVERESFPNGYLRDDDLEITFDAVGAHVQFLSDLPPVEDGMGSGRLTGNGFRVTLDSGSYGGWDISEASFEMPAFDTRGEPFRVYAIGNGPVENVMKTLSESRLAVEFDRSRLSGTADITFELFRPALTNVPYEDIRFSAIGTIDQGGLKNAALGFDLTQAIANVTVNQDGMTISGYGDLGPSPVQFTWRDGFSDGDAPSMLSASSVVTPDFLNEFGVLGRAYLSGEVPMEVQAEIAGSNVSVADASLDLTEARLDLSEIGWIKSKGKQARASVRYYGQDEGYRADVVMQSDDAYIDGDFSIGTDSKLEQATLRRAYLKNKADVGGKIIRRNGRMAVELNGTYLDVSGALPGVGAIGGGTAEGEEKTPLDISAEVDALTLRPGLDMRDAKLTMVTTGQGVEHLSASGKADDGSPLEAVFDAGDANAAKLHVTSGNAGFLAFAFLGIDFLDGGSLELDGTLPKGDAPAKFDIAISGARMQNAPFLTQILSLASLRGLADTLGGEGVLFSRIDVPLTVAGNRYVVEGAKAQGPALGLTANGSLETGGKIEFDGVLVPSFGMNSALGTIPIIGDLVVGRDGEGVFSLTYAVRGTMEKANVSVNPLSALAPGVIRRIFENPSDTRIPEAKARPAEEPIPSELPPIPDEEF
ncbi:MAG: hypothetical protein KDA53_16115 [Hyphomonas sp.]|nr:hypothetical protein [Hyphomonas sp.]